MRFILNMASGENLTDEPGNVFDHSKPTAQYEPTMTLQAPQARLAMTESNCTSIRTASLTGIDLEALIRSIKD